MADGYPVNLEIDYPGRKLNRLTTFFRIFMLIPIMIVFLLLVGMSYSSGGTDSGARAGSWVAGFGFVFLPLILMLLFRKKYPRWWYDWNLNMSGFTYRLNSYFYLLTDVYPSTDEEQAVHLTFPSSLLNMTAFFPSAIESIVRKNLNCI